MYKLTKKIQIQPDKVNDKTGFRLALLCKEINWQRVNTYMIQMYMGDNFHGAVANVWDDGIEANKFKI